MLANQLALCMIAKDEAQVIGRCLSSVAGIVSEIVVVDTGSVDRTRDIAREHGAMVVTIPWNNDFAYARNVSLAFATRPWIVVLDADEELDRDEGSLEAKLGNLLVEGERRGIFGFNVQMVSYVGNGTEMEYITDSVCRLFRNDRRIRYSGALHEEVYSSVARLSSDGVADGQSWLGIRHYGYLDHIIEQKRKKERNRTILDAILLKQPDDPYGLYALGTEYYQEGDYREALRVYERIQGRVPGDAGYLSDLKLKMAFAYRESGARNRAIEIADEALREYPDFPDLLELRATLALDLGENREALGFLMRAREAGDQSGVYSTCSGAGTYRTLHLIGFAWERMGQLEKARESYGEALLLNPKYAPSKRSFQALE